MLEARLQPLPPGLEEVYDRLWQQVALLHAKQKAFSQLFASGERPIVVLNETARSFFASLQYILHSDIVLSISRLTDRLKIGRHETLSLERFVPILKPAHSDLADEIQGLVAGLRNTADSIRIRRNKTIAHLDLATMLATGPSVLPPVTDSEISDALAEIRQVVNTVNRHFSGNATTFEHISAHGDAEHLLFYLEAGLKHFEEERDG